MSDIQQINQSESFYLLQSLSGILPNLDKMVAVSRSKSGHLIEVLMKNSEDLYPHYHELGVEYNEDLLQRLLNGNQKYQWMDEESIPLNQKERSISKKQNEMFDELTNTVLLVRLRGKKQTESDLYILYFKPDSSNFGVVRNDKILTSISKSIIELMVYNHLNYQRKIFQSQERQFEQFKTYLERMRNKARQNAAKNQSTIEEIHQYKQNFVDYILQKIARKAHVEIALSEAARKMVEQFEGNLEQMEAWIEDAFDFAKFTENQDNILIIDEWHLEDYATKTEEITTESEIEVKYLKAYNLLDRLENAAHKVAGERNKITGSTVGQAMNPPISAPAITDALKKNYKKIQLLFNQFPDRWKLIRSDFRPVINIIQNETSQQNRSVS